MSIIIKQRRVSRTKMKIYTFILLPIIAFFYADAIISHPKDLIVWLFVAFGIICNGFVLIVATKDYLVDEVGIRELGFFGKIRLKQYHWSDFAFVGVLDLKARFRDELEGPAVVCATFVPKMRFSNSTQYVLGNKGVLKFEYDPELYETIMKLKNVSDLKNELSNEP